ncbi:MAG: hypothetical protein KC457_13675, partial [Myxococcales bacterium]|nr:hypothetical protein [Myxococcales bacterium]
MSDHSTRPISREVRIPSWVLAINLGPRRVGPEKLLLALWVHATWGAVGPVEVWPSVDALARDVGRPRSTVEKWLAVLVSEGLITRLEGRHGWLLAWAPPPAQEGDPPVQECPPTQADPPAQAEKTAHPGGSIRLHRSTEQDKNKPIQQKNPVAAIEVDPPPQEKKPPTQADPPA